MCTSRDTPDCSKLGLDLGVLGYKIGLEFVARKGEFLD